MRIEAHGKTDVGQKRGHNEDYLVLAPEIGLFVVCDGMGGHAAGEVASKTAANAVVEYMRQQQAALAAFDGSEASLGGIAALLRTAIEKASSTVYEMARSERGKHGMGTTCIALLTVGTKGVMGHVGDSRLYLSRAGRMYQLSTDHTYVNEAVRNGMMSAEDAAKSPYAHAVTRGVGIASTVAVDTLVFDVIDGDTYLLCSDGLSGYTEDPTELSRLLDDPDLANMPTRLVDLANQRGGKDNITALCVRAVGESPAHAQRRDRVVANIQTLRLLPLFMDLDEAELVRVFNYFMQEERAAGEDIIIEGERSQSLYVIVSGQLQVKRKGQAVAKLNQGSHFGEMALLDHRPRTATVSAVTGVALLRLDRAQFHNLLQTESTLGAKLLYKLAQTVCVRMEEAVEVQDEGARKRTLEMAALSPFKRG